MTATAPAGPAGGVLVASPAALRRERMHDAVRAREFAGVADLAHEFGVSAVTVRSDLRALERHGRVRRVRGGAVARPVPLPVPGGQEDGVHAPAARAAALVADGDTVLLDGGAAGAAVARALATRGELRGVTVVATAIAVALELAPAAPRIGVVLTGGRVLGLDRPLADPCAPGLLGRVRASLAVVGCEGVDLRSGVTAAELDVAGARRAMVRAARRVVLLAGGAQVGRTALGWVCDAQDVELLLCGPGASPQALGALRRAGCAVEVVGAGP